MNPHPNGTARRAWRWRLVGGAAVVSLLVAPAFGGATQSPAHASLRMASETPTATSTATPSPTATTTATAAPTATPTPTPTPTTNPIPSTTGSDITIVQGNLESPQSASGFQADAATVLAQGPDFITYNEVAFRYDTFLAPPPGYALWRTPGQYTGATPVAWRTDRWVPLASGTYMISDKRGLPPRKQTELGRRNANWVTLQGVDGRIISLVSVHIAPTVDGWVDLRRASVKRLTGLVAELDDHGPVLVGGDFNLYHLGSNYPKDLFDAAGMVPTFDELGTRFPTYDRGGAIIDYVFRVGGELRADVHYPVELNSDHDAVVAGYSWTTEPPNTTTKVASNPEGTRAEQRAVSKALNKLIAGTTEGQHLWIGTAKLEYPLIYRSMLRAAKRGVKVRLVTRSPEMTFYERKFLKQSATLRGSWVKKCGKKCTAKWRAKERPTTVLLVTAPNGQPLQRADASRYLRADLNTRTTTATFTNAGDLLAEAARFFRRYS